MPTDTATDKAHAASSSHARGATLGAALMAGFLGLFLLWGVGFAQSDRLHNAAHDTRHSNGFPCH
jgi:cobalt transporter subunit CbtB